jgi:hypothetical protein
MAKRIKVCFKSKFIMSLYELAHQKKVKHTLDFML